MLDVGKSGSVHANPILDMRRNSSYSWYVCGVLTFTYVFCAIDRLLMSIAIVPLQRAFSLSDTQLGLLTGLGFALLYCISGVAFGRLTDITNRRNLIIAGVVVWTLATAGCAFASDFASLFLMRLFVGLGEASLVPAALSMLAAYFTKQSLGSAVGIFQTGIAIGKFVALVGGGSLLAYVGSMGGWHSPIGVLMDWQVLFVAAAVPGILVVPLLLTIREPQRPNRDKQLTSLRAVWAYMKLHRRAYLLHTGALTAIMINANVLSAWTPTFFVRQFGMDLFEVGLLIGILGLFGGALGTVLGGKIMDRLSSRHVKGAAPATLALGLSLGVPSTALFILADNAVLSSVGWVLALITTLMGAAPGLGGIQTMTPPAHRGILTAVIFAAASLIAVGFGPTVIGLMNDHIFADLGLRALGLSILTSTLVVSSVGVPLALLSRTHNQLAVDAA